MGIILYATSNDFSEVLKDKYISKNIRVKLSWSNYLYIDLKDQKAEAYLMLKYSDYVKPMNSVIADRAPIINVDYTPKKSP